MSRAQRSSLAKFRCGVAPLRLETGRYENLAITDRICRSCTDSAIVEDEVHVVTTCPIYNDLRDILYQKAESIDGGFSNFTDELQLYFVLSNINCAKVCAKVLNDMLERRKSL